MIHHGWLLAKIVERRPGQGDQWACHYYNSTNEAHLVPLADDMVHEDSADCICGPRVELLDDHPIESCDVWLYSHHALDGRP